MIRSLIFIFVFLFASLALADNFVPTEPVLSDEEILETRTCDWDDCSDYPYRYECKAWVYVTGYKCEFKYEDYAYKYCKEIAEYWGYDKYDDWKDYCKVYKKDDGEYYCAHYYAYYHQILGRGKSDVFKQFKNLSMSRVYNGHTKASLCIKFDKACKAY